MAAKIKISRPYPDDNRKFMRVWGWIPMQSDAYKREKVVDVIYQHLTTQYTLHDWREMNSARDKVTPNENNAQSFLRSLLNAEESSNIGK
ncbi:MAG: hypothetical protein IGS48_23840 [Oscillatoriales cyanobacterium C42_A2020_001]|nr:hypothetical protein [Leptolyngbyaceae cyanobacterium C42_A2020_001]